MFHIHLYIELDFHALSRAFKNLVTFAYGYRNLIHSFIFFYYYYSFFHYRELKFRPAQFQVDLHDTIVIMG